MSWQAAIWAGLATALALAVAWYELRRPSSKTIALVAALAAAAVAGRILFAAIPNVQPTTDIVFIAGYVLGAAPGAFVGVLAALVSNIFFGQGPWTPWQMLAWGLMGVFGAGTGWIFKRQCKRWVIATCCAIAGIFFGVVMNFSLWITFTDSSSAGSLLVLQAGSIWFDFAHAAGNFLLAAAAGPALVQSLWRYRRRFEVSWSPAHVGPVATIFTIFVLTSLMYSATTTGVADASTTKKGIAYLKSAQNNDGGFGSGTGQNSTLMMTGWAAIGLAAVGEDISELGDTSVIDYLRAEVREIDDLGDIERTMIALDAAGLPARKFCRTRSLQSSYQ